MLMKLNERRKYGQSCLNSFAILLTIAQREFIIANEDSAITSMEGLQKLQKYEFGFNDLLVEFGISQESIDARMGYEKDD